MKQSDQDVLEFLGEYPAAVSTWLEDCERSSARPPPVRNEELDRPGRVIGYGFGPG